MYLGKNGPLAAHLKNAFVVIGERVLSMPPQRIDSFSYPDRIQFAALPHPTETLPVAAGIPVRGPLLLAISKRVVQRHQAIEDCIAVRIASS